MKITFITKNEKHNYISNYKLKYPKKKKKDKTKQKKERRKRLRLTFGKFFFKILSPSKRPKKRSSARHTRKSIICATNIVLLSLQWKKINIIYIYIFNISKLCSCKKQLETLRYLQAKENRKMNNKRVIILVGRKKIKIFVLFCLLLIFKERYVLFCEGSMGRNRVL